eukprot:6771811-Pyramimonas_sp.AAC.1
MQVIWPNTGLVMYRSAVEAFLPRLTDDVVHVETFVRMCWAQAESDAHARSTESCMLCGRHNLFIAGEAGVVGVAEH